MVSADLKRLEADLGVSLVVRTTRRLALTEVGERFYHDCGRLIRGVEVAVQSARGGQDALTGTLRITSTAEYGTRYVVAAIAEFSRLHSTLRIEYSTSQYHADLIAERFDVAIRLGILRDSSLRAVQLQTFEAIPVTTAEYLDARPAVNAPGELSQLDWVEHAQYASSLTWTEKQTGEITQTRHFKGKLQADTAIAVKTLVLAGCGVAILPDWLVAAELREQRLTQLLPDYALPQQAVYAVFPNTVRVSAKVRHFVDFIRDFVIRAA
jgi:DNA-binding transcriptional LysR family regulator